MSNTIYRVMGKRGRITIPYEFRQQVGFGYNDILSFTKQDDNTVIVKREKICDNCKRREAPPAASNSADAGVTLRELLDSLTPAQQKAALVHLADKLADSVRPVVRSG
ncbi:MAG: AbrB/MazE/SpoVT family DNA-binding domain-containing protein [Oscillospiraceae bacterium]|nr:AbrB/MazE/SpoVT family DNA-binding domain-containing protein [Oscillospiraceae bacterium]MBR2889608.1 AbrB/MazE/SpoVT family DNA-binding domain-containing protein [Oscillospiraceae bacterium]